MKKLLLIITVILTSVSAVWAEDYSQGYYTMSPGAGSTYFGFYSSDNASSKYGGTQTRESAVVFTFEKTVQDNDNVYYWYDCNNNKYIYADDSGYLKVSDGKNTNDNNYKWFIKDDGTGNLTITDMTNYNSGNPTMGLIQLNSVGGWWASKCTLSSNSGKNTWKLNLLMKKNTPYYISLKRDYYYWGWKTTYRYLQCESSTMKMKQSETNNKDASYVWYINDVDYGEINLFTAKDAVNAMGYTSNASAGSDKISTTNPVKSFNLRQSDNSDYPIAFLSTAGNNTLYISNYDGKDTPNMGLYGTLADDGTRMKVEEAIKYDVVITKPQSLTETPTVTCNLTGYSGQVVQNGGSIYIGKGNTLSTNNLTIPNYPYYKYTVSINDYVITVAYNYCPNREGITVPEGCNGYIGGITDISETEWKTQEYWSLSDNWNNYGPGCSVSGSAQGMWNPIYLKGITSGTVPTLDGWKFRMIADNSKYTIESVGKIQYGDGVESYITLKNTSVVTMNMGTGSANPFTVNLDEGTGNKLNFVMSNGFNSTITVNYGTVSENMNREFNASGTGTISTLNLNATIEGTIESDELTRHSVFLGRINSTPTDNITAANFTRTTGVLEATNDNIGKYSVVKDSNGDVTLYWVTGPLLTVLTNAYAGARNINDGILTVNDNSSTISKNANGDIVLNNETGFNTTGNTSPLTTISFRITLDTPTSFTKIFTYSTGNDWHVNTGGEVGIGINPSRQLEGLWNGNEWNTLTTDALSAGEHIITVTIGESDNGYGTRVYGDGGSILYSASGLKTSNKTYKYILINHDIADKINALYVYNRALVSTEVKNVVSAINALPTQVNEKCYIIKGHSNNNLNVYYDGTYDYVRINTTSGNNDNYKWAIYTIDGKSFLYNIGSKKFVCQVSGIKSSTSWPLKNNEANEMIINKYENNNNAFNYYTFRTKKCKGEQDYLHYNSTYTYGSTNWGENSPASQWRLIEIGNLTQEQQQTIEQAFKNNVYLSEEEVNSAKAKIMTGVGYPKETTDTYKALNNLSTNTKLYDSEHETVVDIDNIVTAYKEETDVELPVNGKAYYIINGQCNSSNIMEPNKYVLYNNSNNIAAKAYSTTLDESCIWVVRKISEGYYALVSATGNGGYLHWTDNTASNTPLVTTYSAENEKDKTIMHIAKIVHDDTNVIPTNDQLFGYLSLRGFRAGRDDGSDSPIIFKGAEAAFDATVADIVSYSYGSSNAQFSSAVQFVEVPNYTANQVSLKAPKKTDGKTYSSIYLPYPVKVPEGVKAYYCTLNENSLHLEDIGEKIPAQTGAILIGGTEASTQTLVPATTETTSKNVSDNVLSGVLTNTVTSDLGSRIYVLNGGQSAGIGFYPYSQSATLTAYKAYYNASARGARDFYLFGSDDSATGIEDLSEDVDNQNETFDNTRKVLLDGKVVVVRNGKKYSITGQIYK